MLTTAHKPTQTIKDMLHTMNTIQIQLQLQLAKLTALVQEVFTRDNVKQITTETVHRSTTQY
jgi:hypothetical protein